MRKRRCWIADFNSAGGDEKIGENDDQRALPDFFRGIVQRGEQGRAADGLDAGHLIEHEAEMRGAALGRNFDGVLREAPEPDGIALLRGEIAERAREPARVVEAGGALRSEAHRAAGVDQQAETQVGVGLEFLDVKTVAASPRAPVEPARVVAGNVFAILRKLERRAAHWAAVLSRDAAEHRVPRVQRQRHQPAKDRRVEKAAISGGCGHGLNAVNSSSSSSSYSSSKDHGRPPHHG